MLVDAWRLLDGKKAYIGAVALVLTALVAALNGEYERAGELLAAAATAAGLRHALAKKETPTK